MDPRAGVNLPDLLPERTIGARFNAGTSTFQRAERPTSEERPALGRPISPWAFAAVAVASFGGPLALAALSAPGLVGGSSDSAGLAMLIGVVVFTVPLLIWFRYSRYVNGPGGLYGFVEAAAGRQVALAHAGIWIFSYVLYLVYTTVQIVYDVLPAAVPGEVGYQSFLALAIPVALAGVMIAGRGMVLAVLGVMAVGQVLLAGVLDGVTLAHLSTPAASFTASAPAGSLAKAGAQTSLLYICGSLPLFLGGELSSPARTIRRGLSGAYLLTGLVVILAVAPLAAAPGLLNTDVPGVAVAQQFAGQGLAEVIGIGVAVSIAGVMVCEYLALTRLVHAVSHRRVRPITLVIAAALLVAAPFSLIDPEGFYNALLKPSLVALWLSQLVVFAVYPRFAAKHRQRMAPAVMLSLVAGCLVMYGLWTTLQHAAT